MDRVPILRIGRTLLVTLPGDLHDRLALALESDLASRVVATGARGVLLDVSGLDVVDSFLGRMIAVVAGVARLLDAATVVVGMRPAVAITLVELGLELEGVSTALDVERGMALIEAREGAGVEASGPPGEAPEDDGGA